MSTGRRIIDLMEPDIRTILREELQKIFAERDRSAGGEVVSLVAAAKRRKCRPARIREWIDSGKLKAEFCATAHGGRGEYRIKVADLDAVTA